MRTNTARTLEHTEHSSTQAEIIELRHLRRIATEESIAPDFEAFLSQYGDGIASDFA